MRFFWQRIDTDQRGMALISALMLILVISLTAVGVSTDTSMNVRVASYQRFKARATAKADAGAVGSLAVLLDNEEKAWAQAKGQEIPYPKLSKDYNGTITLLPPRDVDGCMGTADALKYLGLVSLNKNPGQFPTMKITGDLESDITTQYIGSRSNEGSSLIMAAGYEGVGKSAAGGGVTIVYSVYSEGKDATGARTKTGLYYGIVK